jgi:hypothetical protein
MANAEPTAPSADTGALAVRIAQLDQSARTLRANGRDDMAAEVERERDWLAQRLAQLGGPPVISDAVALLSAISEALTVNTPGPTGLALLADRVEWTRVVVEAVLKGTQDLRFAATFLAAQTARLQPEA